MPWHPFQRLCGIDKLMHRTIFLIHIPQRFGNRQRFFQFYIQRRWDLFGDLIGLRITDIHNTPDITNGAPGGHGSKGHDLSHMIVAIFFVDVIDDFSPSVYAEVHVDIRHGYTLRIQKSLKKQRVLHGVHIGNVETIADDAAGGTASPGTHRDLLALCIPDEIGNDQEVIHEPHGPDHVQLILQLFVILGIVGITLRKSPLTKLYQILITVRLPCREGKFGKMVVAEFKIEVTARSNLCRIFRSFRLIRKQCAHLIFALQIKLIIGKPHTIVQRFARLYTQKNIVVAGIFLPHIVCVVGHRQWDPGLLRDADQSRGCLLFFTDPVILDLQVETVRTKQLLQFRCFGFCILVSVIDKHLGNLAGNTAGQTDQTFRMFSKEAPVDSRLYVKALCKRFGDQIAQVMVALFVFAKQDKVRIVVIDPMFLIFHSAGRHIDLTSDNRFDPLCTAGLIKGNCSVHYAMIRHGQRIHSHFLGPFHQVRNAAGAV